MEPVLVPVMTEALVLLGAAAVTVLLVKRDTVFPVQTSMLALLLGVPRHILATWIPHNRFTIIG